MKWRLGIWEGRGDQKLKVKRRERNEGKRGLRRKGKLIR